MRQTLQEIEAERLKEQARIERRQRAEKQHGEMLKTVLSEVSALFQRDVLFGLDDESDVRCVFI